MEEQETQMMLTFSAGLVAFADIDQNRQLPVAEVQQHCGQLQDYPTLRDVCARISYLICGKIHCARTALSLAEFDRGIDDRGNRLSQWHFNFLSPHYHEFHISDAQSLIHFHYFESNLVKSVVVSRPVKSLQIIHSLAHSSFDRENLTDHSPSHQSPLQPDAPSL